MPPDRRLGVAWKWFRTSLKVLAAKRRADERADAALPIDRGKLGRFERIGHRVAGKRQHRSDTAAARAASWPLSRPAVLPSAAALRERRHRASD